MQSFLPAVRAACCAAFLAITAYAQARDPSAGAESLRQLVEQALRRNPDLLVARQRLAEARGLLRQAGMRPNPSIDVAVGNGDVLASRGERQLELGYSHTVELGGKRGRRMDAAELELELAALNVNDRERLVRADVKSRYTEALAAMRNLGNSQRVLDLTRKSHELAEARIREGEGAPLEQGLLRVEVNRIDSDRVLFLSQVERAVLDLRLLAGMDQDGTLRIAEPLAPPALTVAVARLLETALAQRPDIQAARLQERLADTELSLARAQASPDLVLTGRYAHVQSRFGQYGFTQPGGPLAALRDKDNVLTAGVAISLPIRNRNQGNVEAAIARSRAARLRREALERSARQEVLAAVNRYEAARRALAVFDQGVVQQSQENLRIVRGAYDLGELRLLDVINEQRRLLETQRAYTELLREANVAAADLERAVGVPIE
jgi:cobalt-zinc-cadmium efflux system outer membrane protein